MSAIASARAGKIRGPLHGIPIALKDNIQTTDLPTTGGALAFANLVPPYDATLTKNLRDAGAIIMAKTQLTELANWVAGNPPMPTNYNALNGYGFNPYDPRRDPRTETGDGRPALATGGSSSGAGTDRELLGRERRQRDLGIDPQPVEPEHARRDQADRRPHLALRRHPHHRRSGHAPARWRSSSPTPRSSSASSKATIPIRTMPPRRAARRRRITTTRSS